MAKQVQLRRGTTAELSSVTGAAGEVIVDTTKDTLTVHDAYTAGGTPLLREDLDNLANNSIGLGKIATGTQGQILYYNASGQLVALNPGTSGYVLQTNGAGQNPSWGLRGILQVQRTLVNNYPTYSGSADVAIEISAMAVTITPILSTSKIMLMVRFNAETSGGSAWDHTFGIFRNGVQINPTSNIESRNSLALSIWNDSHDSGASTDNGSTMGCAHFTTVDIPNSTSSLTYVLRGMCNTSSTTYFVNRTVSDNNTGDSYERTSSEIIAMEIA